MSSKREPYRTGITPLRARRLVRGEVIRQVAEATGLSRDNITRWEVGAHQPNAEQTAALAAHYGCTPEELHRPLELRAPTEEELMPFVERCAEIVAKQVIDDQEKVAERLVKRVVDELKSKKRGKSREVA